MGARRAAALHHVQDQLSPGPHSGGGTCRGRPSALDLRVALLRERKRISDWIDAHCWSEVKKAYAFYAGTDRLDASLVLAVRFGFDNRERLSSTVDAIRTELAHGPWVYRYSGADAEEGAFIACTFWLVEAYAELGRMDEARALMEKALAGLPDGIGLLAEMIDPETRSFLGNLPQGLSHLALIHAALSMNSGTAS